MFSFLLKIYGPFYPFSTKKKKLYLAHCSYLTLRSKHFNGGVEKDTEKATFFFLSLSLSLIFHFWNTTHEPSRAFYENTKNKKKKREGREWDRERRNQRHVSFQRTSLMTRIQRVIQFLWSLRKKHCPMLGIRWIHCSFSALPLFDPE